MVFQGLRSSHHHHSLTEGYEAFDGRWQVDDDNRTTFNISGIKIDEIEYESFRVTSKTTCELVREGHTYKGTLSFGTSLPPPFLRPNKIIKTSFDLKRALWSSKFNFIRLFKGVNNYAGLDCDSLSDR